MQAAGQTMQLEGGGGRTDKPVISGQPALPALPISLKEFNYKGHKKGDDSS